MTQQTTVAIAPEAALRALSSENEWRRNRILVLEQQLFQAEQRIAELEAEKPATDESKKAK